MNLKDNKKYIKAGLTGFLAASATLAFGFLLFRMGDIFTALGALVSIVTPFLYGAVLAYLLAPFCNRVEGLIVRGLGEKRRKAARGVSIVLAILMTLVIVATLSWIVIPQLARSVVSVANALPGQLTATAEQVEQLLADRPEWQARVESIFQEVTKYLEDWRQNGLLKMAQSVLSGTASYLTGAVNLVKNLLLGLVISVYFLAIRKQFGAQARLLLRAVCSDKWVDWIEREVHYSDRMFNGFFMGKLLDSAIMGVLCFIGCLAMGFSSAPLISVIVGVTNIIPFFGPFIGAVPCALLLLLEKPVYCLMFVIFIVILQQLDGNIIGPVIMGNTTGLSGFWVTFAILLFGGIWGITGMIIGVPLFAVIYDVLRRLCYRLLRQRGRQNMVDDYKREFHPIPAVVKAKKLIKRPKKAE